MPKPSYEIPSNPPATDRKFRSEDEHVLQGERREFMQSETEKKEESTDTKGKSNDARQKD